MPVFCNAVAKASLVAKTSSSDNVSMDALFNLLVVIPSSPIISSRRIESVLPP